MQPTTHRITGSRPEWKGRFIGTIEDHSQPGEWPRANDFVAKDIQGRVIGKYPTYAAARQAVETQ